MQAWLSQTRSVHDLPTPRLFPSSQLIKEREHALALLPREAVQALVVRVIHVVVDAVLAGLVGAGVCGARAALGGRALRGRVGDVVALARAGGALEDVEETQPLRDALAREIMGSGG